MIFIATAGLLLGPLASAIPAADLSRYREVQLGGSLPEVAKQIGVDPSRATTLHRRPALIQELEWLPQSQGAPLRSETVKTAQFRFYKGNLFQIVVNYDHYETEGLTPDDIIDALAASFGPALRPPPAASRDQYYPEGEALAHWEDNQFRFDLLRLSYGPSYRLVGIAKQNEALARAASLESRRLDEKEAPQREAERLASEDDVRRVKAEKARTANKPRFRP